MATAREHAECAAEWSNGLLSTTDYSENRDTVPIADPLHAIAHALTAIALVLTADPEEGAR